MIASSGRDGGLAEYIWGRGFASEVSLVLENARRACFAHSEGEYLELPGNRGGFQYGAEIELELPAEKKNRFFRPLLQPP